MVSTKYDSPSMRAVLLAAGNSPMIASRLYEHLHKEYIPQDFFARLARSENNYSTRKGFSIPPKDTVKKIYSLVSQNKKMAAKILGFSPKRLEEVLCDYGIISETEGRSNGLTTRIDYSNGHKRGNGRGSSSRKPTGH
ncbi:MAG: hypothetical protein AABW51_00510 [Nanoarchaeota archaeon]